MTFPKSNIKLNKRFGYKVSRLQDSRRKFTYVTFKIYRTAAEHKER